MKVLSEAQLRKKLGMDSKAQTHHSEKRTTNSTQTSPESQQNKSAGFSNENLDPDSETPEQSLKKYFISLLSRREYAQQELQQKATSKAYESSLIAKVIEELVQDNLQSDLRYAEMLIRSRINKQSGPFKIRMELKQKNISESLIEQALENSECDWFVLAESAAQKKASGWTREAKNKAKLIRFLQGRGFSSEHIQFATEQLGY